MYFSHRFRFLVPPFHNLFDDIITASPCAASVKVVGALGSGAAIAEVLVSSPALPVSSAASVRLGVGCDGFPSEVFGTPELDADRLLGTDLGEAEIGGRSPSSPVPSSDISEAVSS